MLRVGCSHGDAGRCSSLEQEVTKKTGLWMDASERMPGLEVADGALQTTCWRSSPSPMTNIPARPGERRLAHRGREQRDAGCRSPWTLEAVISRTVANCVLGEQRTVLWKEGVARVTCQPWKQHSLSNASMEDLEFH